MHSYVARKWLYSDLYISEKQIVVTRVIHPAFLIVMITLVAVPVYSVSGHYGGFLPSSE